MHDKKAPRMEICREMKTSVCAHMPTFQQVLYVRKRNLYQDSKQGVIVAG